MTSATATAPASQRSPSPAAGHGPIDANAHANPTRQGLAALTLAAIGVVYGDIGTSPLYTVKEVFQPATGVALNAANLVGAISAIVWALMLVVTLKYVILILRADNHGEGGGLALTALAAQAVAGRPRLRTALLLLGVAGATLFYGDSVITPAISVLGALEGLTVLTPTLTPYVLPASVVVLIALFALQRLGTAVVGRWFGPVIVLWFVVLAAVGLLHISRQPAILAALNPLQAWAFLSGRGAHLLPALGAIVLALTGAEALYADMGHFGRRPIQWAWCALVLPALALNYLGQGALLMADPSAIENPFFKLFPDAAVLPAVVLATLAAIIASQAVISGAYSMTRQAIQLGFLPRMVVRHTSAAAAGQIYLPAVNAVLLVGVLGAVLGFGSSTALAGAYGIAVTLTMMITTVLTWFVVREGWRLPLALVGPATLFFLALDALLVAGCAIKLLDGGWFPLAVGALLLVLMTTWAHGRRKLVAAISADGLALAPFIASLQAEAAEHRLPRVPRTAVYPVADASTVPQALLHNLKHNQVLHERNLIVTVVFDEVPWVAADQRAQVDELGHGFQRVRLHFGFMDTPDVPLALAACRTSAAAGAAALDVAPMTTSYFLSRETVVPCAGLAGWRERLFAAMSRSAGSATQYFRLPDNAVVELGTRVQI
jgi:KUP system potassium uptake protein